MSRDDRYLAPPTQDDGLGLQTLEQWAAALRPRTTGPASPLETASEPSATARSGTASNDATVDTLEAATDLDDDAETIDFHEELGADDGDELSSLELLYEHAVGNGAGPWVDENLAAELAETARLASLATRPTEPPAARRRIVPPRRSRPPDETLAARESMPTLPVAAGRGAMAPEVLRRLTRSSENPRPLTYLEAAETLESVAPPPALPDERSLLPTAVDRTSGRPASASEAAGRRRRDAGAVGRFGVLAAAMLGGALAMAWLSAANRPAPVQSDLGRLAAGVGDDSPSNCAEPAGPGASASGLCDASDVGDPGAIAAAGVSLPTGASSDAPATAADPRGREAVGSGAAAAGNQPGAGAGRAAVAPSPSPSLVTGASGMADQSVASRVPDLSEPPSAPGGATATGPAAGAASATVEPSASDGSTAGAELGPFDAPAARAALGAAASTAASSCRGTEQGTHLVPVAVTFAPSGRATTAIITGSIYKGTSVGGCIAQIMKATAVSPFAGGPVTVQRTVTMY